MPNPEEVIRSNATYIETDETCWICGEKLNFGYYEIQMKDIDPKSYDGTLFGGCLNCGAMYSTKFDDNGDPIEFNSENLIEQDRESIEMYHSETGLPAGTISQVPLSDKYDYEFTEWYNNEFREYWEDKTGEKLTKIVAEKNR